MMRSIGCRYSFLIGRHETDWRGSVFDAVCDGAVKPGEGGSGFRDSLVHPGVVGLGAVHVGGSGVGQFFCSAQVVLTLAGAASGKQEDEGGKRKNLQSSSEAFQ
jgi:hypothetical protein